jgi:hypothetical protein
MTKDELLVLDLQVRVILLYPERKGMPKLKDATQRTLHHHLSRLPHDSVLPVEELS